MAKPDPPSPEHIRAYIPKPGDPVMVEGVILRLVVVSVDGAHKTATVAAPTTPAISYSVPWSKLSRLDESQNAARIVKEATEGH
ncbi:MAG: hypothetical protein WAM13_06355 [Candidatus Sulfotelmatobacter sp.]